MTTLRVWVARVGEAFRRNRIERDLRDELASHLDLLTDDYVRRGYPRDAAHRAACRDLGGVEQTKELIRERRGLPLMDMMISDVRYACRLLLKTRGFTLVAVLTLALGIGVNAAIFSLVDGVMLRPLPYPDSERLMSIWEGQLVTRPAPASMSSSGLLIGSSTSVARRTAVAPANLADYRNATTFADMAGYASIGKNIIGGTPERLIGEAVTWNYFAVLGIQPAIGRAFLADEDRPGADRVVIISDGLWHSRFGADEAILGRTVTLDNDVDQIVGVMPPAFRAVTQFAQPGEVTFWIPAAFPADLLANRGDHEINIVGRLKAGATVAVAQQELTRISEQLATAYPATNGSIRLFALPLREDLVTGVHASFVALMLIVGLILLIACVNVANLLLVRSVSRRREVAIRIALGASRWRVMGGLITEGLVLAALACAAGLALGIWTKGALVSAAPKSIPRLDDVHLDARVIGFTMLMTTLTGLAFGVLPAWQAGRARPIDALRTSERVVAGTWVMRWRSALMVGEIAISTILLVGAGLMLRSLVSLNHVDLGFAYDHVLAMNVNLPDARYKTGDDRFAFFDTLADRISRLPGVESVGFANRFPLRGGWSTGVTIDGVAAPTGGAILDVDCQAVSPGYFHTLGVALVRGRLLTPTDTKAGERVAVVNQQFSHQFLGGADPVGRRFQRGPTMPWITVVGVVNDIRRDGRDAVIAAEAYLPAAQTDIYPVHLADLAVRASGDPATLAAAMRREVWAVDGNQPVTNVRTLEEVLSAQSAQLRFRTLLFTLFAALALCLAIVGVSGVVSYSVSQRTPEIGVRMALGADSWRILRWILGQAVALIVAGAVVGVIGALGLSRYVSGLLFHVTATDPITYFLAAAMLGTVALAASYAAARRATHINPVTALRRD